MNFRQADSVGQSEEKFLVSFGSNMTYKVIPITMSDPDEARFKSLGAHFCQAILDNLEQRFPGTKVLDPASWPDDPVDNALFGGNALVQLCKKFYLSATETADFLFEFAQYKKGKKRVRICLMSSVYPISTRFSQMNLQHTDTRNRLTVQTVGNALMLSINGPPLEHWGPRKYVISWLITGRQGALYKPIGLPKSPDN